jgi:hypothetical protein
LAGASNARAGPRTASGSVLAGPMFCLPSMTASPSARRAIPPPAARFATVVPVPPARRRDWPLCRSAPKSRRSEPLVSGPPSPLRGRIRNFRFFNTREHCAKQKGLACARLLLKSKFEIRADRRPPQPVWGSAGAHAARGTQGWISPGLFRTCWRTKPKSSV